MTSARRVLIIGVNGWCSANWRSPAGIVSVGTKALLMKGSITRMSGVLLAVSTLFAARPIPTVSQVRENAMRISSPIAPSQPSRPASERNPSTNANAATITTAHPVLMTAPSTWPVSTATRAMFIVRNRAMIPVVMSVAVERAVPSATLVTVMSKMPGVMKTR